jgi:4a-hydroxytetrahydrobiopterin dehydratase
MLRARTHKAFTQKQVSQSLEKLSEWEPNKKNTEITKTFTFPNFVAALAFLAKVTVHAEIADHHPTAELSYGKLVITLSTHSAQGLTKKDFDLAKKIDGLGRWGS